MSVGISKTLIFLLPAVVSAAGLFNYSQCQINAITTFTDAFNASFLVDSSGSFTNDPNNAWGIIYAKCIALCGSGWEAFDWYFFSTSVSSWVLPWLALTAQFPYETRDSSTNLLSVLLAVGSPMLITYSLCLTVLNSRWINIRFRALCDRNEEVLGKQVKTMEAARIFLRESQHIPLEASGSRSTLAQLVVSPENRAWWYTLRKEVLKSKREWYVMKLLYALELRTYSLLAQVIWVILAVISAISDFFNATVDNSTMGIGVAINSLWIWMIPVTLGFVWVGTQRSSSTIRDALMTAEALVSEESASGVYEPLRRVTNRMIGFRDRSSDEFSSTGSDLERCRRLLHEKPPPRTLYGISIAGFEMEPGPIFNYARASSHFYTSRLVIDAFETLNARLEARHPVHRKEIGWNYDVRQWKDNLHGSPEEMEAYIYPPNYRLPSRDSHYMNWHYLLSTFIGVVLQWGTTGAAILTAYNTPVVGLGCESGAYLLYGSMATLSWALLALSAHFSHQYTLCTESSNPPQPSTTAAASDIELGSLLSQQTTAHSSLTLPPSPPLSIPPLPPSFLLPLIPLTRFLGVLLGSLNAIWLLLISILQFTNVYNNCWCESSVLGLGTKAWIILWATEEQIVAAAWNSWVFAAVMSFTAVMIAGGFFVVVRGEEVFRRK
ncbi:hypothetical protein MMC26_001108 [Xylographa opegraphella]|nr:hypothetical protein [Xylographa opegraphella]